MNYAKLSEAAIVGGAGCVKGIQPWSSPAPSSTLTTPHGCEPSDLCSGKWPTTRWGGREGGEGGGEASWWQVDCLGGTHRQRQVRSLLPLFTEVTDREIWADMYSSPRGSIITEQRLSGELPFQQSGQRWRLGVAEGFVCWSQDVCQLSLSKCIR